MGVGGRDVRKGLFTQNKFLKKIILGGQIFCFIFLLSDYNFRYNLGAMGEV